MREHDYPGGERTIENYGFLNYEFEEVINVVESYMQLDAKRTSCIIDHLILKFAKLIEMNNMYNVKSNLIA